MIREMVTNEYNSNALQFEVNGGVDTLHLMNMMSQNNSTDFTQGLPTVVYNIEELTRSVTSSYARTRTIPGAFVALLHSKFLCHSLQSRLRLLLSDT